MAVPPRATFAVVPVLFGTWSDADLSPGPTGANSTATVQVPLCWIVLPPHRLAPDLIRKLAVFVPPMLSVPMTRGAAPVFVIVTVCDRPRAPSCTSAKWWDAGVILM